MKQRLVKIFSIFLSEKTDSIWIQSLRYFLVGGIAFIVDISLLLFLETVLSMNYLFASGISFIFGLIVNFALSISWIFNKDKFSLGSIFGYDFLIFIFTGLIGLGLTELFMYTFTDILKLYFLVSKTITVPLVLMWNFISRKLLVSRK